MMKRLLPAVVLGFAAIGGHAQDYPSRAINIIVPNPPGGMNQIHAQPLSAVIEKLVNQPAPVINRPGGTAAVGTAYVANQPADGYNLLVTTPNLYLVIEKVFSSSGPYGITHTPMAMFMDAAGLKMRLPTTGGGPAITQVLGGHAQITASGPAAVYPHVQSGKLRELIRKVASDPLFKQALEKVQVVPDYRDAPEFRQFFDADYKRMAAVVRKMGKI
ncbi:MAG: hypothetical protein K2Y16_10765 [Burkholderiales bacterium]|nr:hypothetical protein [Burkholderiales bacterium]